MALDFDQRPILIFWESTRACLLACKHCRAEAMPHPAPGELSPSEGLRFIESLTGFGRPFPVLIITGGDVLMRPDAFDLVTYARQLGIPVGLAPSVTPKLTDNAIRRLAELGVSIVSISLDGATAPTHEKIRGVAQHFGETVKALARLVDAGFTVQVNTVVMRENVAELPALARILKDVGVRIWEVFFLIPVGRGQAVGALTAAECEDVCHFLYDASAYDLIVRTVEAPFFRRIVSWRNAHGPSPSAPAALVASHYHLGALYPQLAGALRAQLGAPTSAVRAQSTGTRDGKGIIFVSHNGTVYPAGFLPLALGNVRERDLVSIYREHPLLKDIRAARFTGRCGGCEYRNLCGGSRARAFALSGDPLGEDPACAFEPVPLELAIDRG
ncbi:MAG TPA: TIGR04053 family radical SAM/SPASM domain-containing protein [Ktedonobacterales bacterium]